MLEYFVYLNYLFMPNLNRTEICWTIIVENATDVYSRGLLM